MKKFASKNSIIIFGCTLFLVTFGCVMVYSASKYSAIVNYNDQFFYLKKQVLGVVLGLIGLIICSFINHKIYSYWLNIHFC